MGLIPARGGSRGLPRKSLRLLAGQPLICHTIDAAKASRRLTHLVTTTDSEEIAATARQAGSEVLLRPAALAADDTPTAPVIQHAVTALEQRWGRPVDIIVLLQPTSPLRTAEDIDAAIALLTPVVDAVASVYALPKKYHPDRAKRLVGGMIRPYLPEAAASGTPRQQLPDVHKLNGAVYVLWRATIMERGSVMGERTAAYLMPLERSVDIDDALDLKLAELLLAERAPALPGGRA